MDDQPHTILRRRGPKPGGRKPAGSGKKKGSKNKTTIERERLAAQQYAEAEARGRGEVTVEQAAAGVIADRTGVLKLGKQILSEFANVLAGMAASYQPAPRGMQPRPGQDEVRFRQYAELAVYAAEKVAQYESPKLAAMMIGQVQTKKIAIVGGLPDPVSQPVLTEEEHDRAMKVVNGSSERHADGDVARLPPPAGPMLQ